MDIDQKHPYHSISIEDTLEKVSGKKEGLSSEEAGQRQEQFGKNKLPEKGGTNPIMLFLKQFKDFLILILFIAAGIAFWAEQMADVYIILAVILFNAIMGFTQEYKAEKAIESIKKMEQRYAYVLRDGKEQEIEVEDVVPGDIMILKEGKTIPADGRLLEVRELRTAEASLTGESMPIDKETEPVEDNAPLGDRTNMAFKSTNVVNGKGKAVVTAIADKTEIGKIATSMGEMEMQDSNFRKKTGLLGKQMAGIAIVTSLIVFVLGYWVRDYNFQETLLVTIAVLVSIIPEGLPAVISIVLAIGANRMAKQNVIIREFTATEMMGSVSVILVDKTGTLTQSILVIKKMFTGSGKEVEVSGRGYQLEGKFKVDDQELDLKENPVEQKLLTIAAFCNDAHLKSEDQEDTGKRPEDKEGEVDQEEQDNQERKEDRKEQSSGEKDSQGDEDKAADSRKEQPPQKDAPEKRDSEEEKERKEPQKDSSEPKEPKDEKPSSPEQEEEEVKEDEQKDRERTAQDPEREKTKESAESTTGEPEGSEEKEDKAQENKVDVDLDVKPDQVKININVKSDSGKEDTEEEKAEEENPPKDQDLDVDVDVHPEQVKINVDKKSKRKKPDNSQSDEEENRDIEEEEEEEELEEEDSEDSKNDKSDEENEENDHEGPEVVGDPTEAAMFVVGRKAGIKEKEPYKNYSLLDDLPFKSEQKFRASLVKTEDGKEIFAIGAPEKILDLSNKYLTPEGPKELTKEKKEELQDKMDEWADQAMRVLALGYKQADNKDSISPDDVKDIIWVGITGIIDPPRKGVPESIQECKSAGIRVVMVTGDHKKTAAAIARDVGILSEENKEEESQYASSMTTQELDVDDEQFDDYIQNVNVFARMNPDTKLRIAERLQAGDTLIAMTGDGVNDAPALKRADVGIAMGIRGTDVAKDASEIVLQDDNFSSIVNAIREGRIVFNNVKITSYFLLTTNFAFGLAFIFGMSIGLPLLLTAVQILYVNLVTAGIVDVALATEPGHGEIMKQPPVKKSEKILKPDILPFLILVSFVIVTLTLLTFNYYLPQGEVMARTATFIIISMTQIFNVFNMRSLKKSIFEIGPFTNFWVNIAFVSAIALQFLVIKIPALRDLMGFDDLPTLDFVIIMLISTVIVAAGELYKYLKFKKDLF